MEEKKEKVSIQGEVFGVDFEVIETTAILIHCYVEDDGLWYNTMSLDVEYIDDMINVLQKAKSLLR